jgi:hypothetical protein
MAKLMVNHAANAAAKGEIGIFGADFTKRRLPRPTQKKRVPKGTRLGEPCVSWTLKLWIRGS